MTFPLTDVNDITTSIDYNQLIFYFNPSANINIFIIHKKSFFIETI